ncbi:MULTISPECIES: flagellar hook-basal body complex protein [Novosphingobium]|uniref:flagellar hook-basal body complex protein n=1 Tax=Novosphingobium TaxID=165696 RepID=UPI001CD337A3|nr:flagellar hook-basal body complex protein [Novosphingobium percolationis]
MSFYTSLNGLKNAQTDLNVISHNIANAETVGFKKSRTEFADIVAGSAFTNPKLIQGIGATLTSITQNFAQGAVQQTGSALDLMVNGDGFFTTKSSITGDTYYTRNGAFSLNGAGNVVDDSGNILQVYAVDATGAMTATPNPAGGYAASDLVNCTVPATNTAGAGFAGLTILENGDVTASYADGSNAIVGKIAVSSFIAPNGLKQVGSSNWTSTGTSGTAVYGLPGAGQYGSILSGTLERSNVDIAEELVGLITAQRDFQANAKAIDTATQISQTIINLRT